MVKKIHYCWFGGKKLPKSVEDCIKTWKKFLPDYEIKQWDESNFDVNSFPFVKEAYESKKWAFVSDYVRIYALYNEGGLYLDTDVKILKDPTDVLNKEVVLGYEDSGYVGTAMGRSVANHQNAQTDSVYGHRLPRLRRRFGQRCLRHPQSGGNGFAAVRQQFILEKPVALRRARRRLERGLPE